MSHSSTKKITRVNYSWDDIEELWLYHCQRGISDRKGLTNVGLNFKYPTPRYGKLAFYLEPRHLQNQNYWLYSPRCLTSRPWKLMETPTFFLDPGNFSAGSLLNFKVYIHLLPQQNQSCSLPDLEARLGSSHPKNTNSCSAHYRARPGRFL